MHYTVYKITNEINGKIYIGYHQTKNLNDGYMGSGTYLKNAQAKYGIENFSKEILFDFNNPEDMKAKEKELVNEDFLSRSDVYNQIKGGADGWSLVNESYWTKEKRLKVCSIAGKAAAANNHFGGNRNADTAKARVAALSSNPKSGFHGKSHTDEWKKNHSETMKNRQSGKKNSQFGSMWITDGTNANKISQSDEIPDGWRRGRK